MTGKNPPLDAEARKRIFFDAAGIEDVIPYQRMSPFEVIQHFNNLLHDNIGLSEQEIADAFNPPAKRWVIATHFHRGSEPDENFLHQFGEIIRPFLELGVENKWLKPKSLEPRKVEDAQHIISGILQRPDDWLEGRVGLAAVSFMIEQSHVPPYALGPMLGYDTNWFSTSTSKPKRSLQPADIASVTKLLKPYLEGKKWEKYVEVKDPQWLENHAVARDYLVARVEDQLGDRAGEFHAGLPDTLPATLGDTLRILRTHVDARHTSFKVHRPRISGLEKNCFNPNCLKDGKLIESLQRQLDTIANDIARMWGDKHPVHAVHVSEAMVNGALSQGAALT